jgi:UDP-N-acetyl-D-galactosamine dehydrogenase
MINNGTPIKGSKVHVFGLAFKEDVPDLRNSRVIDIIHELESYGVEVAVHDPLASEKEALHEYDVALTSWDELPVADAIIMAVPHEEFLGRPLSDYQQKVVEGGCFIDVKSKFDREALPAAGFCVWRL